MSATTGGLPAYFRWEMWAGDTEPFTAQFFDAADAPLDLTGRTVRVRLTHVVGTTTTVVTLVSGTDAEVVVSDQTQLATRGQVIVTLTALRTDGFPRNASRFVFEIAVLSGTVVDTAIAGDVVLKGRPA